MNCAIFLGSSVLRFDIVHFQNLSLAVPVDGGVTSMMSEPKVLKKYSSSDDRLHIIACRAPGFKRAAGRCGNSLSLDFLHLALGLAL